ncbi:colicin E3-like toxin immunity protein [Sulfurovum sp.]|uniref:colicin E3-like toxin immunity protein n=1 Tax=Sulfurovum sp. TaxID=1969726 RepID=UPI00356A0386
MVRRYLQWYSKDTEFSVGQENLKDFELNQLQKLFGVPSDDPMYDCWEVNDVHLSELQKHVDHRINLAKYSYFIEASG